MSLFNIFNKNKIVIDIKTDLTTEKEKQIDKK